MLKPFIMNEVKKRYVVIYLDATFVSVRRDRVQKEALHSIIGIDEDGNKEVLDYDIYPSESSLNYKSMLESLKQRGLKEVLLFVSDGLTGLQNSVEEFPNSKYQSC